LNLATQWNLTTKTTMSAEKRCSFFDESGDDGNDYWSVPQVAKECGE
jgi:hypothetical protein